jgi:hypothetical protein
VVVAFGVRRRGASRRRARPVVSKRIAERGGDHRPRWSWKSTAKRGAAPSAVPAKHGGGRVLDRRDRARRRGEAGVAAGGERPAPAHAPGVRGRLRGPRDRGSRGGASAPGQHPRGGAALVFRHRPGSPERLADGGDQSPVGGRADVPRAEPGPPLARRGRLLRFGPLPGVPGTGRARATWSGPRRRRRASCSRATDARRRCFFTRTAAATPPGRRTCGPRGGAGSRGVRDEDGGRDFCDRRPPPPVADGDPRGRIGAPARRERGQGPGLERRDPGPLGSREAIALGNPRSKRGEDLYLRWGRRRGWHELKSTRFNMRAGDRYVFAGRGLGHGVGLCQHGAAGRARAGFGFREILGAYFPGLTLDGVGAPPDPASGSNR